MDAHEYLDFELRITSTGEPGTYGAHVYRSPGGEGSSSFEWPFSPLQYENYLLKMGHPRAVTRSGGSPGIAAARALGDGLFRAVFQGAVRDLLRKSQDLAEASDKGLRIRLRLQDAPDLGDVPWEFLYDADLKQFIAQSVYSPVVRFLELPRRIPPLKTELPLRVLGVVASPTDLHALAVDREIERLEKLFATLHGLVEMTWVSPPTLSALQSALQTGRYHVFHFIGHGALDHQTQQGVLLFEDEFRRSVPADAFRLGRLFGDHRSLRLALLNSCEGARNTVTDPFASVAATLVQQGVAAVTAMQFEISDDAAIAFADSFYSALANGLPVDAAVVEGRKAIFNMPNDVEWGTPVLYLRAADGVLFTLHAAEETAPEPNAHPLDPVPAAQSRFNDRTLTPQTTQRIEPVVTAAPPPDSSAASPAPRHPARGQPLPAKQRDWWKIVQLAGTFTLALAFIVYSSMGHSVQVGSILIGLLGGTFMIAGYVVSRLKSNPAGRKRWLRLLSLAGIGILVVTYVLQDSAAVFGPETLLGMIAFGAAFLIAAVVVAFAKVKP